MAGSIVVVLSGVILSVVGRAWIAPCHTPPPAGEAHPFQAAQWQG
jgi:hypothetical protein